MSKFVTPHAREEQLFALSKYAREIRYRVQERRARSELAEVVAIAKFIASNCDTGHHGSEQVLERRKSLFRAEIAEAETHLKVGNFLDDDWEPTDERRVRLAKAIADFLNRPLPKSWAVDDLIDELGRLP
jgi:hypothetical protein